jgi:hypothetical protein
MGTAFARRDMPAQQRQARVRKGDTAQIQAIRGANKGDKESAAGRIFCSRGG